MIIIRNTNRFILFFILLLLPVFLWGQNDIDKDQQQLNTLLYAGKLDQARSFLDDKFLKSGDASRQVVGYIFLADYYKLIHSPSGIDSSLEALKKAKEIAAETHKEIDEAYVEYGYTGFYKTINKWDLYVKSLEKSISIFKKYPNQSFMLSLLYIEKISFANQNAFEKKNIQNYLDANQYAKESKNTILISSTYDHLASFYMSRFQETHEKKDKDSAQVLFDKSFQYALKVSDPVAKKKLQFLYYINAGSIYADREPGKILEKYQKGLKLYNSKNENFYLFALLRNIGYTYFRTGDNTTALEYYLKAESVPETGCYMLNIHKIELYHNISEVYQKLNQYDKALAYQKKAEETIVNEDKRVYSNNTKSLETFYQTEQEKNILEEKNKTYRKNEIWYILAITSTVAGLIFLFFTLHYRQKLSNRTTSLLESEKEKLKMEHQLSIIKQEQLQKQALAASIQLEHKNIFISELKESQLENKSIQHLLKVEQMVDGNFSTIRNIIQGTHPNFFKHLNDLAGNSLTNTDLKYATYIYLNIDNIQIATALKVDPKTVSVTKHRLKQKLKIEKKQDLNHYIRSLRV